MKHTTKSTALLLLVLVFVLALSAGCGMAESGEGAGQPASDGPTVKRLANFETGAVRAKLPDSRKETASSTKNKASADKKSSASIKQKNAARAKDKEKRAGKVANKAGSKNDGAGRRSGKVRLKIGGDPGTEFSGTCTVGGEQRDISGQVPERYAYDLNGERLSCEIRILGPGTLEATSTAGGDRQVQKIKANGGTLKISYSGNGFSSASSSTSSVTGSSKQSIISSSN